MDSRLRTVREAKGLSRQRLAEKAGISRQHLTNLENGANRPSLDLSRRLAAELGCRLEDIFPPPGSRRVFVVAPSRKAS